MSLLTIVRQAAAQVGIANLNSVVGNTDTQVRQLLALSNEEGKDLAARHDWQELIEEASFTTVASEDQGNLGTIAAGLKFVLNNTMYDRTSSREVRGTMDAQKWARLKASSVIGPFPEYRIRGDRVLFLPVPPAGNTISFEFQSKNWVRSGVLTSSDWIADSDTSALPEDLLVLGLVWRFLRHKGLAYAEQFADYERRVMDTIGRNGAHQVLYADNMPIRNRLIQEGSWPV